VASRGVTPAPRGKPSGIPYLARMVDVARQAGLVSPTIYGAEDHKDHILETIGCGVAVVDFDGDGWLDILVLSGTRLTDPHPDTTNRLYRNRRDGTFEDVTERAGLVRRGWASAVAVADYDNDGDEDLFITYWGQNVLYRNEGGRTFRDVTREAGLLQPRTRWGAGATFLDYDRDGDLDLFVANYLEFDLARAPKAGSTANCLWKGIAVNCGPRGLPTGVHALYRNEGNGMYSDVSTASGVAAATGTYGMTAVAADLDNDGWPDVYVAADSTASLLFHNTGRGTFVDEGLLRGAALSENAMEQAGMGAAIGDYDTDGDLDIFKTHFTEDTNVLYRNDGRGTFDDATSSAGLGVETRYTGWGATMNDFDNDGWPDLLYVTGSVYPEVEKTLAAYPWRTPRVVFRGLGNGAFEELIEDAGPGIAAPHSSRGAAFGDLDNDGDIDAVVVNVNEPPSLLRNELPAGKRHWLQVKLQSGPGGSGTIGARITLEYSGRRQVQEVQSQASFYSANDKRLHYGLGDATSARLQVRWPDGETQVLNVPAVDRVLVVRRMAIPRSSAKQ
jgi:enediyne biosynthesis protein E4